MSKEDFAHGVEKASYVYQSVINEYVAENARLKQLVSDMAPDVFIACEMCDVPTKVSECERGHDCRFKAFYERMVALEVEVMER